MGVRSKARNRGNKRAMQFLCTGRGGGRSTPPRQSPSSSPPISRRTHAWEKVSFNDGEKEEQTARYRCSNCNKGIRPNAARRRSSSMTPTATTPERRETRARASSQTLPKTSLAEVLDSSSSEGSRCGSPGDGSDNNQGGRRNNEERGIEWSEIAAEKKGGDGSDCSVCSCGEMGCRCRCDAGGPGPMELRFFPLPLDFRELVGLEEKAEEDFAFCCPECEWSHRLKQEMELGKRWVTLRKRNAANQAAAGGGWGNQDQDTQNIEGKTAAGEQEGPPGAPPKGNLFSVQPS